MSRLRAVLGMFLALAGMSRAQQISQQDRTDAREMLRMVADDVRKNYYDPTLLKEFEARVTEADAQIKTVPLLGQAFAMIGWALDGLHDDGDLRLHEDVVAACGAAALPAMRPGGEEG